MCVKSGYKTVTPIELANCLAALERKEISLRAVRVFFAGLAMVAVREAASRSAKRKGRRVSPTPRFLVSELVALTGLSKAVVKGELRRLKRFSIIQFTESAIETKRELLPGAANLCEAFSGKRSPKRPIPIPRAVLRFLARSSKASVVKAVLGYIVRGLSLSRNGEVSSAGTAKASWIAASFGLSLRGVKAARKELIERGLISKDTGSFQWKLNRDGAYFRIDLAWTEAAKGEGAQPPGFSPRLAKSHPVFAPPYKDRKTSYESKNQKTQSRALKLPGVCKANLGNPTLRDVKPEDLRRYSRLRTLFEEAVSRQWVLNSEASFLNWVAAAVRAQTVKARCPVRVFLGIVKGGRYEVITQAQEERARAAINRNQRREEGEPPKLFHGSRGSMERVSFTLRSLNR